MPDPENTVSDSKPATKWMHPNEVIALHRLKIKKRALQARLNKTAVTVSQKEDSNVPENVAKFSKKRRNPFLKNDENKRPKCSPESPPAEDSEHTLFELINSNNSILGTAASGALTSFSNVFNQLNSSTTKQYPIQSGGEKWIPIDWALKTRVRFMSPQKFDWSPQLKTSEEASGITGFVRCIDTATESTLDTSPNACFHQHCLYWQQPYLPWLTLFPRTQGRVSSTNFSIKSSSTVKESLQIAWQNSFRSLFQLLRARQCPYFYVCANTFTVLFRAAGVCGFPEMHAIITPTTRGFRQMLKQADISFILPLKTKRSSFGSDTGYDTLDSSINTVPENNPSPSVETGAVNNEDDNDDDDESVDEWMKDLGISQDEIQKFNYTQSKIKHKAECEMDNSDQSTVFVDGVDVQALYVFLINCKSAVATTGPLAGVPPTLLSPVAFLGATVQALNVRENKISIDNAQYNSIELVGPILPHVIHNLFPLNNSNHRLTAVFANVESTASFSKVNNNNAAPKENEEVKKPDSKTEKQTSTIFGYKNLSDCGLSISVLKHFCCPDPKRIVHLESVKYDEENKSYTWVEM